VPGDRVQRLLARAIEIGQPAWEIGSVVEGSGIEVV